MELTPARRVGIGLFGGFCLVMVRMLEAGFYLDPALTARARIGGLLAAAVFILMAAIVAYMVDEQVPWKVFTQALVAPTLLVAIIHQGADTSPHTAVPTPAATPIRQLGESLTPDSAQPGRPATLPGIRPLAGVAATGDGTASPVGTVRVIPAVFHQLPDAQPASPVAAQLPTQGDSVIRFGRRDLGSGLAGGVRLLAGRETTSEAWVYVLGQTPNPGRASAIAARLRAALPDLDLDVRLLQPAGDSTVYLTVQGFLTAESAQQLSARVRSLAYNRLAAGTQPPDQVRRDLGVLASGTVVSALSLIEQSEALRPRAREARRPD